MTGYLLFDDQDRLLQLSRSLLAALDYESPGQPPELVSSVFESETGMDLFQLEADRWHSFALLRRDGSTLSCLGCIRAIDPSSSRRLCEMEWEESEFDESGDRRQVDPASLNFLTTVSHELRVALNGVIGFSNVLNTTNLDAEQKDVLEKLQSCNFLLKGLVNDILEFSRVVSSNLDLATESVPLMAFTKEICSLFRERATRKGLAIEVECSAPPDFRAQLPKLRVTQVLSNLMSNAIKFTVAGWVRVSCSVSKQKIRFEVQDTGIGIPGNQVEKVFRPFVQIGVGGSNNEGSGLGLAISKTLAERMGGSLALERPSSGGSLFVLELPLLKGSKPDEPAAPTPSSESRPVANAAYPVSGTSAKDRSVAAAEPRPARNVLVVEDNQLNADILSHFLRDYGVTYDVVDNGRSAVEAYRDGKYDLVLMDVMLPELNGYEATEQILARSKRENPVPIIGVTAKVFRRDQVRCIEAGMVDVVHKPVDFKLLRRVLDRYLFGQYMMNEAPEPAVAETAPPVANAGSAAAPFQSRILEDYIARMKSEKNSRQEVVDTALRIVDSEVEKLKRAIMESELDSISMRAHSLKGALALLGAKDLLELVKGLESLASKEGSVLRREHWRTLIGESYDKFRSSVFEYVSSTAR